MIFLVVYFFGAPSGLGALRTARSARYGSGGTVCVCVCVCAV